MNAIKSVQAQTFSSWELIIVDDGSTDITPEVAAAFARVDSRIRYVAQTNQGPSSARNHGLKLANGKYIAFIDSDDTYDSRHLQVRHDHLTAAKDIDLVHSPARIIGDPFVVDTRDNSRLVSLEDARVRIGGTFAIRKSALEQLGGFQAHLSYSEDGDLFDRALQAQLKISKIALKTYNYYRTSADSICTSVLKNRLGSQPKRNV